MKGGTYVKDFDDFKNHINKNCLNEIQSIISKKLEIFEERLKNENEKASDVFFSKLEYENQLYTMEILRKYHEWLNS